MTDIVVTCRKHGALTAEEAYKHSTVILANGEIKLKYICKVCSKNTHSRWAKKQYSLNEGFKERRKESQKRYIENKRLKEKV